MIDPRGRRGFLRAAIASGAAWAAVDVLHVEQALAWAAEQAPTGEWRELRALTPAQAQALDAVASRIIPSVDGRPGAHEAGVVFFIDRALFTFNASQKGLYLRGVQDLNRRAARVQPGVSSFAGLEAPQQDQILRDIEKTPFFQAARTDTIIGMFALPSWGGNRDYAGWHLIGLDHQMAYQPPFGFYDADANRRS